VARFRLIEKIGTGGMGDVYRARDTALERDVALKILPAEAVGTAEKRRRFETEAKAVAALQHPNIVPVYDIGEAGGIPYIVQELVDGQTVDEMIWKRGSLPADEAAELGGQAAEALAHAHQEGVLHRDVKPGNLIVGKDGRLRVLDFGLAKILERPGRNSSPSSPLTSDGIVVGTVDYMSPEQAQGRPTDGRSDVFSLGIVLYEMATGQRPFVGGTPLDVMTAIVHEPAAPASSSTGPLPDGLVVILEKALEKRPDERFQSAGEMAADLRRFLRRTRDASALRPILRPPAGDARPLSPPGKPRRSRAYPVAAATAALVLTLLLGAGAVLVTKRRHAPQPPLATRILLQTDFREQHPVYSPDGKGFAYTSNQGGSDNVYYRLLSGGTPVRLTDMEGENREPCFTPDGGSVLFTHEEVGGERSVWAAPTLGGPPRRIVEPAEQAHVSRDGRQLVFVKRRGERTALVVSAIDGTSPRTVFARRTGRVQGPRFSSDGATVAFVFHEYPPGNLGDIWRVPSVGGDAVRLTTDRRDVWGHVEFLPSDSGVLFASTRTGASSIWMVPFNGGPPVSVVPAVSWVLSPSISPDGRSLLAQSRHFISDAWEFSLPDGKGHQLTNCGGLWDPSRLPDGRILYADWSPQEEELDIVLENQEGVRTLVGRGASPFPSPDGKRIYFSMGVGKGQRVLAVVETAGGPPRKLTFPVGNDDYPVPTADEKHVVFKRTTTAPSERELLMILDLASGAVKELFAGDVLGPKVAGQVALFASCAPPGGCGVYAMGLDGGEPRLLIPGGHYPAPSLDGKTIYAWVGRKADPVAVSAPIDGSAPPKRLFDFNASREVQFWAVHTLNVTPDGRSLIATRQWMGDDIILLEGVFR